MQAEHTRFNVFIYVSILKYRLILQSYFCLPRQCVAASRRHATPCSISIIDVKTYAIDNIYQYIEIS